MDGLRQSLGSAGFPLLLVRADVKLLLARGCWTEQLYGVAEYSQQKGMGEPNRPTKSSLRTPWGIGLPLGES